MDFFAHYARKFFEAGYDVIPIRPGTKAPASGTEGYPAYALRAQTERELEYYLARAPRGAGLGIVGSPRTMAWLDADTNDPEVLARIPRSPCGVRGAKGAKWAFRTPWATAKLQSKRRNLFDPENGKAEEKLELLCHGGYGVYLGVHPDTEKPYEVLGEHLADYDYKDLPELTERDWEELCAFFIRREPAEAATKGADLSPVLVHADGSRCPHGSHDRLKALACGMIAKGKPFAEAVEDLLRYDERHHTPPYFSDQTRTDVRGLDRTSAATKLYANLIAHVNAKRAREGLPPQLPAAPQITVAAHAVPKAEAWEHASAPDIWELSGIELGERKKPVSNLASARRIIAAKPGLGDAIWWDGFHYAIMTPGKDGAPARAWIDSDTIDLQTWLQEAAGLDTVTKATVRDAVIAHARMRERHEVREWLQALPPHDGRGRLGTFCAAYLGTAQTPYNEAVGQNLFVSLVARIMAPGCKVDSMPILEGKQGKGKSSALKAIVGARWFGEATADIHTKDFMMSLGGAWLIEIPELDAMVKGEPETIKRVLSTQKDKYRVPYASFMEVFPRQSVFAGTTNASGYLRDHTGGRRFWPIECGVIRVEQIAADREQLFAEALALFRSGATWYDVPEGEASEAVLLRTEADPWENIVMGWVLTVGRKEIDVNTTAILSQALKLHNSDINRVTQGRVKRILEANDFKEKRENNRRFYIKDDAGK